jgi:iron complex outermembrane receptor protein
MRNVNGAMLLRFHKFSPRLLALSAVLISAGLAQNAFAQSSGTEAVEEDMSEVVVSATRVRQIGLVGDQTAPKSRVSLSGDYLDKQTAGNTLFQAINQVPGVNFTSNDGYGTSGGNLRIRGFDGSRVSVTFDGIPLNDSGNYALFTNQMLDPELVDRVDVNLGTADVDSPTASATGGTVAFRTRRPSDEFSGQAIMSGGTDNYMRGLLRVDTGEMGPWGTKAFVALSHQEYDKFKGPGELKKDQFNAMIRQDFENQNFISLAFHWNRNRNAFFRTTSDANYQAFGRDYDNLDTCTRDPATFNVIDNDNASPVASTPTLLNTDNPLNPSSCANYYGVRINPSDTGNIRMQSLWHLGENLRLSFDPSWQYTLANGGGSQVLTESFGNTADVRPVGNTTLLGFDLNGDNDILDTVRFYAPNTTNTKRWGINTSLIWDLNDTNRLRLAYTWDRARHRQTGMYGPMEASGKPEDVFAGRQGERLYSADGQVIRGRDRFSIAELNQYSLEWRGLFAEDKLVATVGVRAPFFTRQLNQYCYTPDGGNGGPGAIVAGGGTLCINRTPNAVLPNGNVTFVTPMTGTAVQFIPPYSTEVKFDDILPNLGLSYTAWGNHMFYVSYAEGLSAPRTDNLYSARRQPDGSIGTPLPESETTKAFDLGWRLNAASTLASVALWKIDYTNRIVSTFDPDLGYSVDRNVGDVDMWGAEAQIAQRFGEKFSVSASGSYTKTELQENQPFGLAPGGVEQFLPLEGNALVETPELQFALRTDFDINENIHLGLQGKWVDERFSTDLNDETTPAYTVVDFDASWAFPLASDQELEFQFNVTNVLDEEYYGTISSGIGRSSTTPLPCIREGSTTVVNCVNPAGNNLNGGVGFFSIGAPRTYVLSVKFNW